MWLINKWESQTIDVESEFLYAVLEEEIYMKIPEGMEEVLEEHYTYKDILILLKPFCGIIQAACFWFKKYIKTMTLKVEFSQ